MFLLSVKAWRAPGRSPWSNRTSPSLIQLREIALPLGVAWVGGGELVLFLLSVKAWRAPGRSPWATRTSPSLFQLTARSHRHLRLPGSAAAEAVKQSLAVS